MGDISAITASKSSLVSLDSGISDSSMSHPAAIKQPAETAGLTADATDSSTGSCTASGRTSVHSSKLEEVIDETHLNSKNTEGEESGFYAKLAQSQLKHKLIVSDY